MNENELMHYGVPGMKWGKRKIASYEKTADRYSKLKAKTNLGKRYNILKETENRMKADRLQRVADAKTFKDARNEYSGDRNKKASSAMKSKMYSRMADATKSKAGQAAYRQRSLNEKEMSKYYGIRDKQRYGKKWFDSHVFNTTLMKTPYHRLSGRTTTIGKNMADKIFTGGVYGAYKDVQYMRSQKRK